MVVATSAVGGSAAALRRRHLQRRERLFMNKRWQPLTLLLVALLCASLALVSVASAATGAASAAELNNISEPTDVERPLLLYIPMHVSEPLEHLQELCDRTLSKDPWVAEESGTGQNNKKDVSPLAFDILLVVSGPSDASRNVTERFDVMRAMLEAATGNLPPSPPRIFTDFKAVGVDRYNLNLAEEDKDAEWVSGPNSVFYDAFAEGGEIYEKYVRFYALVQQLETDVCALRGGWISSLLKPMLVDQGRGPDSSLPSSSSSSSPSSSSSSLSLSSASSPFSASSSSSSSSSSDLIVISGSTIKSSCSYVVKYDECQPFEPDASYMIEHVNGNAVYRTGDMLQQVLKSAREQFKNAEPFDLAIHHVLKASNATDLVHSNPLYHNAATLLDRDWFLDFRYHGVDDLAVLHAPRRLLADGLKTVATRAQGYLPTTTVVLAEESMDEHRSGDSHAASSSLLKNFKAAADELRLSGVIYIALSEAVFFKASRVVPLQVLPAFERRNGGAAGVRGEDAVTAAVAGTAAAATAAAAAAASAAAAAAVDPKSVVLTWPPTSPSPALRLLATITQLVTQGYSPLVVNAASVPLRNYDMVLYGLPKDAVFFTDTSPGVGDEVRRPFSERPGSGDSRSLIIETMYAPASAYTANFLQAWAVKMLERQQGQGKGAYATASATTLAAAMLSIANLKALAACRFETMSGFSPCPWRGVSVQTLPVHWFAPQDAFFGSGWTRRARKHALFLDMSSGGGGGGGGGGASGSSRTIASSPSTSSSVSSASKLIFRLRQAGKWDAPARCPTFSVFSRLPRDLTHETVFEELTLHADFLSFVRERKIACAVLPGFRIPLTGATLPVDALLDLGTLQVSAGSQATILPRVQDVEEASQGYVAFDRDRATRRRKSKQARSSLSQHHARKQALSRDNADLCSALHHFGPPSNTACLAKDISRALDKARSALPSPSFVCALDARRTVEEVALVGLRGATGLGEVAAQVSKATDAALRSSSSPPSSSDSATVLLTGAWRLLPRGSFGNGVSPSSSLSSSSANVVTLSDLHSHDQKLQCAQELNPKASPLADEAWTGVLEALLCRDSVFSVDVSQRLSSSFLEMDKKNAPRSKSSSAAALSAGHRKKTNSKKIFAELVARHILPSILLEDVTTFAKWLARPDRPNLVRGRSLQFLFASEGGVGGRGQKQLSSISSASSSASKTSSSSSSSRHKAALQSLSMLAPTIAVTRADYAFLPAAADATTGELLPWSRVTEIGELYRVRPTLLPPSLAAMMHPKAVLEFLLSPQSSTLPLEVAGEAAAGARNEKENAVILDRVFSQNVAFRKTVAALGRMERREAAAPRNKKMWALSHAAAAPAAGHQQSTVTSLPVSSMGASDDVVVRLRS